MDRSPVIARLPESTTCASTRTSETSLRKTTSSSAPPSGSNPPARANARRHDNRLICVYFIRNFASEGYHLIAALTILAIPIVIVSSVPVIPAVRNPHLERPCQPEG